MNKMKSNNRDIGYRNGEQCFSSIAEKLVPGGDALFRLDGKVVFVPSVLPGEEAEISIVKSGKKFSRGRLVSLKTESEKRVEPFCPLYGKCGGCNMQHIDYSEQLLFKTSFIREHFSRFAGAELPGDFFFAPSKPRGYRNRVQFHSSPEGPGFMKRAANSVIPVQQCPVLVPALNRFLAAGVPLTTERETCFGTEDQYWTGTESKDITLEILGRSVSFCSNQFFQSNLSLLPELISYVTDFCIGRGTQGNSAPSGHAMDLYSGVGLFSVFLKDYYAEITGIEMNPETEPYYRKNMSGSSFEFFGQSMEKWLKGNRGRQADFAVVDPPRTGLSEDVVKFLVKMAVPRLVYVSCDPVTQARDTKALLEGGYLIDSARGFDFYPHTSHMESVVRFRREG